MGEEALKTGKGPASLQIASQAATLTHLCGVFDTVQEGFDRAFALIESGKVYESFMKWITQAKN